jgi:hypothetical protein
VAPSVRQRLDSASGAVSQWHDAHWSSLPGGPRFASNRVGLCRWPVQFIGGPHYVGGWPIKNTSKFSKYSKDSNLHNKNRFFLHSKNFQAEQGRRSLPKEQLSFLAQLPTLYAFQSNNPENKFQNENGLSFERVQTLWEKFHKFIKILC